MKRFVCMTMLTATLIGGLSAEKTTNRSLSLLNPGSPISLRLKDDQTFTDIFLVSIDERFIVYQKDSITAKIERSQIFRARQADSYYSDLALTAEDHARFPDYVTYINERGDIVTDKQGQTYAGMITADTPTSLTISTRAATYDIEKSKVAAWRKNGTWYGDEEARHEPSPGIFHLNPYLDKRRMLNFGLLLTGPWAVLPQFGAAIGSNVNWPVFGGIRGSLGYIWVDLYAMGMLAQVSAYLNVNLINFTALRLFAGTSYLWRAGMVIDYAYGSTTTLYRGDRVYGKMTQNIYTIHLGAKFKNLMFEAGVEMPISYLENFVRPQNSLTSDQPEIEKGVGRVQSSFDTLQRVSRIYASMSLMF